ncbi:MAG TPA: SRPBCC family protein [Leptospiraceae bacterium]|nr:SRPBCC family protein [Leptospiraceae bacterium]HMY65150.1 SRPBCC family protein [Leptospiraceae bacterium]HMZ57283.1 SRPBCC family protein [Leptospiraceae bacterium]HNF15261.1 SRPBCC family protein [Leptospiraceae bacterium]HNF23134.1 SRPBCC family protein [Leptospiraceae bacterium]
MKYSVEIEINLPIARVIELFDNPDNLQKWQPGLLSFEHLSGTPGQPGAKSRLTFRMGRGKMIMTETVTVRNLPDEFSGTYEVKNVFNIVKNRFIALSENKTKYISESEFQFKGFMRIIAFFMPGAFKKQSQKYLQLFKEFAEKEGMAK